MRIRDIVAAAALLSISPPVCAQTRGVFLPNAPTGPGGDDSIETASGTRCRQSINSNGSYLDVGVVNSRRSLRDDRDVRGGFYVEPSGSDATAYARVTIPLGHRPKRIDCNQVYELEVTRLRQEIEMLKMGIGVGR